MADLGPTFGGLKIVIRDPLPEYDTVKRGIMERLFSRPWHPVVAFKMVPNEKNIKKNKECHIQGANVSMTDQSFTALKGHLHKPPIQARRADDNPLFF